MGDTTARLVTEIDTTQVSVASKRMEGDYKAAVGGMDRATKEAQGSIDKAAAATQTWARTGAVAMRGVAVGIGAVTAGAAASEKQWLSLGTVILTSFAAGGPVAGGIALVGAAIGYLVGQTNKAEEAAKSYAAELAKIGDDAFKRQFDAFGAAADKVKALKDAMAAPGSGLADETKKARTELDAVTEALARLESGSEKYEAADVLLRAGYLKRSAALRELIGLLTQQGQAEQAARFEAVRSINSGFERQAAGLRADAAGAPSNVTSLSSKLAELEERRVFLKRQGLASTIEELHQLEATIDGTKMLLGVTKEVNAEKLNRKVDDELANLYAVTDAQKQSLALERQIRDLRKEGATDAQVGAIRAAATWRRTYDEAKKAREEMKAFYDAIGQTLSTGLTSLIADGITNGFRNGADIGRQIVNDLLRQILQSLVSSGIQAAFGALFGGEGGGGGGAFGLVSTIVGAVAGGGGGGAGLASAAVGAGSGVDLGEVLGGGCAGGT